MQYIFFGYIMQICKDAINIATYEGEVFVQFNSIKKIIWFAKITRKSNDAAPLAKY